MRQSGWGSRRSARLRSTARSNVFSMRYGGHRYRLLLCSLAGLWGGPGLLAQDAPPASGGVFRWSWELSAVDPAAAAECGRLTELKNLCIPEVKVECQIVGGETPEEAALSLVNVLRSDKVI